MTTLGLFGYGSLVLAESAAMTLGRAVPPPRPATLSGWRRRFSQARDNLTCEKTFEQRDGTRPEWILGLNLEPGEDDAGPVNGAVIELSEPELHRLGVREVRYDPVDVTSLVEGPALPERIIAFTAKRAHYAPTPPEEAVILASYARAVEAAFERLGPGQLERYRATTGPYPVDVVDAVLVKDEIPAGNPRAW
ncbi:MAG TPA: gamma-glutamylcyclotransferase family protein [Solirubrobacterales bacterium]|jgi:cation transport regulator ChaC|nr:gamma-glutamylcyclotransferase family protein [Solirubrobacterales bacterium]